MSDHYDVAVVGAGIVGLSTARALGRAGKRVVLLDRGAPGGEASWASAGMLAPQVEATPDSPLMALGIAARDGYVAFAAECEAAGTPIGLRTSGIIVVSFDDERTRVLEAQAATQRAAGFDVDWLSRADLKWRQPGIAPEARGALLVAKDGCVDNIALCAVLAADARAHGVAFEQVEVVELMTKHGKTTGVRSEMQDHKATAVVIAAGAWSGTIAGMPRALPVEPVRGQMAQVPWPAGEPQAVIFGRAGYIVPRGNDALLGSTMEHVGFRKETTNDGLASIRAEATAILPALESAMFTRSWSGLRPMTPDGLPIIGRDPQIENLLYATGHGRNGILLGPITGEIVRDLMVRGETAWDIAPYGIERFAINH